MKKFTFVTGTMGSAKTLDLLSKRYEYMTKPNSGFQVTLVTPELDDRHGRGHVLSKAGLEATADIILPQNAHIQDYIDFKDYSLHLVLVDEAQFMTKRSIESLRELADDDRFDAYVRAYGIRTDFQSRLFEGSKRLFELADTIEHKDSVCSYCEKFATFNMRIGNFGDEQIVLGGLDRYASVCSTCFTAETGDFSELDEE